MNILLWPYSLKSHYVFKVWLFCRKVSYAGPSFQSLLIPSHTHTHTQGTVVAVERAMVAFLRDYHLAPKLFCSLYWPGYSQQNSSNRVCLLTWTGH